MDYQKVYNDLVELARLKDRKKIKNNPGLYERHHIIPRCLGGSNLLTNIVLLTPKEHFIAHKLLHYIHKDNNKLFLAFFMMFNVNDRQQRDYKTSSREYEELKIKNGKVMSEINTGIKRSEETREKMSNKVISDEYRENLRIAQSLFPKITCPWCGKTGKVNLMGRWHFDHCLKNPNIDIEQEKLLRKHPEELVEINRNAQLNAEKVTCPHCGQVGSKFSMTRYHFENCKKNPNRNKLIICPWCDTEIQNSTMATRWHFENCKKNPNYVDKREILECPWCNKKSKSKENMKAFHFDNCLKNPNVLNTNVIICPHCNTMSRSNHFMMKWHFDNCKFKI